MRHFFLTIFCLIMSSLIFSADYEKIAFDHDEEEGYYLVVTPQEKIEGLLLLLPGFGQKPESIFEETELPKTAAEQRWLTLALGCGPKLYADEATIERLNAAILHAIAKYKLSDEPFALGGFSAGGTIALRYAEYCHEKPSEVPMIPEAIFSVDGPVDLFGIWDYFEREISKDYSDAGTSEAKYVMNIMQSEIGTPETHRVNYEKLTPFDFKAETQGNEKFLRETAVRVYHDVDVNWLLQERRRSLVDCNAFSASEMINRLLLLGNDRAEFIQASGLGRRSSGERHPHSWSIVDVDECVQWLCGVLEKS